jgi:hypothetical protein
MTVLLSLAYLGAGKMIRILVGFSFIAMLLCSPASAGSSAADRLPAAPARLAQAPPPEMSLLASHGEVGCAPPASDREDPPTTSALPGERFVVGEHFQEATGSDATVQIAWLGGTFRRQFLRKVENRSGPTRLRVHALRRPAHDRDIIAALGDRHETDLIHLWCLLWQQPKGEPGTLLNTTVPNIFYVRDTSGQVWAVDAVWGGAGWEIGASSVDDQRPWSAGRRVFSR